MLQTNADEERLALFRRVWALIALALFIATWKLWTPQQVFPQVPLAAPFGNLPRTIDWLSLGGVLASLLMILFVTSGSKLLKPALFVFATSLALSIFIDQHRFQPWAYQFLLIAVVLTSAKPATAVRLLLWLTISIYVWSAWSKCDFTFTHNLGQQLLKALLGWSSFEAWPVWPRLLLASAIPLLELTVAVALATARFRKIGVWMSVVLHALLLIALGPLGLHHKMGVLLWNAYFIVQNVLLFGKTPIPNAATAFQSPERLPKFATLLVCCAIAWPLVEAWSYCDHWPAWSVYAPRVERANFYIHQSEKDRLPPALQVYLRPVADDDVWLQLRLDLWSLDALDAPLYPQNRFQVAAAEVVARQFGLTQSRLVTFDAANRMTGNRKSNAYQGLGQIERATRLYLLGAHAVRPLSLKGNSIAEEP